MLEQAVILVGGAGTRLGALARDTPKPLLPVAGRPFLDYLVDELARQGVADILLLAGHRSDAVAARYGGKRIGGARIVCRVERTPLGTAGALAAAATMLAPRFALLNGDSLFDVNLPALAVAAEAAGTVAHLALVRVGDASRAGAVALDGRLIRGFAERGPAGPALVNGGVAIVTRAVCDWIGAPPASLEREVYPALAAAGRLSGTVSDGFFMDIGVPQALAEAQTALPAWQRRPALFLDRDGVLNQDVGYIHRYADVEWIAGAREAVRLANDRHFLVFVVTNQAGVARGLYGEADVRELHRAMAEELARHGAHVDAFYFCPHHPEIGEPPWRAECQCRKPAPGMILQAAAEFPVDLARSMLIGDKPTDLACAEAAGIAGHFFAGENLLEFVAPLLG